MITLPSRKLRVNIASKHFSAKAMRASVPFGNENLAVDSTRTMGCRIDLTIGSYKFKYGRIGAIFFIILLPCSNYIYIYMCDMYYVKYIHHRRIAEIRYNVIQ